MNKTKVSIESVQPGCIRIIRLKEEGRLQKGDVVEAARLGQCKVAYIQSADSICVVTPDNRYFNLSGLGFKARVVSASAT